MRLLISLLFLAFFTQIRLVAQVLPKMPSIFIQEDQPVLNDTILVKEARIKPFEYQVYPVEVDSKLQIILPTSENFTMRLVDESGNVLLSHYQIFGENQLNLGHLKAAKYFVELSCPKGKVVEEITKT